MIDFVNKQQADLNVVNTCNQPNIMKFMEMLLRELTIVEKSLNDYLETKRRAFPRFYFVSSNDLLDILSRADIRSKSRSTSVKSSTTLSTLTGLMITLFPQ